MAAKKETKPGQGAQHNPHNRFQIHQHETEASYLKYLYDEGEDEAPRVRIQEVYPKSIVNEVKSPDVGMEWSLNPYQGCEHGCSYCYARPTHEYWGYSAGIDFERQILVKRNAPELLEEKLKSTRWKAAPIVMSGNTDCYQPLERELRITRACLEVFLRYRHPVGIITKNALIVRDLDIIRALASHQLVHVVMSINSLDEELRRRMEPRTATVAKRLATVQALSDAGVPVHVLMGPVIPGLNSHEIFDVLQAAHNHGARSAGYTMVRLNGAIGPIFTEWLRHHYPDRAEKVLHQIMAAHDGNLNDSRFGVRMRGEGRMAEQIAQTFKLARKRIFGEVEPAPLNTSLHASFKSGQLQLFS